MKRIGIVSGFGAAAGARLFSLLVKQCQMNGARSDYDFPEVFLHNVRSRAMDQNGIANIETLKGDLATAVLDLEQLSAELILIACNSAHVLHGWLQDQCRARILDMVGLAIDAAAGATKIGVLSSRSTKLSGLYSRAIEARGIVAITTTDEQQRFVDETIERAISGTNPSSDRHELAGLVKTMVRAGAEAVILGCTELPLTGIQSAYCIDPSQVMVEEALRL